ncbi:sugar kinase [Shewanella sp. MMG014]|uniref:sugar kinase n=1 Tax=Shewanella sp. MMG014 TaxID=2822691 RepID=UPI001B36BD91|nr:sugar kinase [Shewanella sp. MMG014]MBQ4888833.1 sugar kinase [Shewanella sp. MMG014]
MKSMLAIGECMMELSEHSTSLLHRAFAGDTYNALVYAKQYEPKIDCQFFSAIGHDQPSKAMRAAWGKNGINSQSALSIEQATIGIYAISTDNQGERSFSYWRNQSAATQMMKVLTTDKLLNRIGKVDLVFFSGISLGILTDEDKHLLLNLIQKFRQQGALIAFDPNYRTAMWQSVEHAKTWFDLAYQHCDIALPGVEEHQIIYNHNTASEVALYCQSLAVSEIVVKSGLDGTYIYDSNSLIDHQAFNPAPQQVDSTAAGDSFAGTYLSSRLAGNSISLALADACFVAREVVQHKGALLPGDVYQQMMTSKINNNCA